MASRAEIGRRCAACNRVAATLRLPNATVTAATVVPAGQFTPPATPEGAQAPRPINGLPAFCRVELTLTPSSDSDIKSEVWLPVSGWNGKFQQVGNGAFAGSIQYGALADALSAGLRRRVNRHRSHRPGRGVGRGPSREGDRLGTSLGASDRG